jgi:hypothetical protein
MLAGYARLHVRPLLRAATAADSLAAAQHGRALASLPAGLLHGLRAPQRPPVQGVGTGIG